MRALRLPLLLVAVLVGLAGAGCCALDGTCVDRPDAGPPPPVDCSVDGTCVFASPGCDPKDITDGAAVGGAAGVCALCSSPAGDAQICGAPDVARCESREDLAGKACRFCATAAGDILFDSCVSDTPVAVVSCEPSVPGQPVTPDANAVCETCKDATGAVVTTTCEPAHDECHDDVQQGLHCRVCTQAGQVVVNACEQPNIEPRSCEVYANEAGRCVDCFSDADQLLSHSCTLATDTFVSCTDSVTPDGLLCTECVDANGGPVSRSCGFNVPELTQCSLLDYTEQTCVVCLDQNGAAGLWSCDRRCADPTTCAPADACFFESAADGSLCRTCPGPNGPEQRCIVDTNLLCGQAQTGVGPPGPPNAGGCLSCVDATTGAEVYRSCNGGLPPTCRNASNLSGATCEICEDSQTAEPVYAKCNGEACFALGQFGLTNAQGTTLLVDGHPAVGTCTECGAQDPNAAAVAFNAACTLRDTCGPVDLTAPSAICRGTVVFTVAPHLCGNPWEPTAGANGPGTLPAGSADELLRILTFALQAGVGLVAVEDRGSTADAVCVDQCGCDRGDRLELVARPDDAVAVSNLFDAVIVRCQTDADCATGGACRVDGSCAP